MNKIKAVFRRMMLGLLSVFPGRSSATTVLESDGKDRIREDDKRIDAVVKRQRLWNSLFPKLTAHQGSSPEIQKIMPWNGGGNLQHMAKLTEAQWNPELMGKKETDEQRG